MAQSTHGAGHASHGHHHIVPKKLLIKIFSALIALTIITVLTAQLDLGAMNVPLALAIACTKAILVVLFFMALKWDTPANRLVATMGVAFVAIFLIFTLFDTLFRGDTTSVNSETIMDIQRREEELRAREPARELLRVAPADYLNADTTAAAAPADTAGTAAGE